MSFPNARWKFSVNHVRVCNLQISGWSQMFEETPSYQDTSQIARAWTRALSHPHSSLQSVAFSWNSLFEVYIQSVCAPPPPTVM